MNNWPLAELAQIYGLEFCNVHKKNKILYAESSIGPLAIKKSTLNTAELELQFKILKHLFNNGFTDFSKIVPAQNGKGFAQIGDGTYLLTTWVNGYHPNFRNSEHLDLAAKTLARFHQVATGYQGPVPWQKRKLYGVWPMRFHYRLSHLEWYRHCISAHGIRDEFDWLFMEHVERFLLQGYQVIDQLRKPAYYALAALARQHGTICHHDYAYHNILIAPDGNVWLIDFDYCLLDMPLHDLGNMISRHVKYTNWCLEDVSRILLMYHQEKPLSPVELESLIRFMEFPQDFWQVAWARYNEINMHRPETLLLRLKKLVGTEQARQDFLAEFSQLVQNKNFLPGRDIRENWY